MREQADRDRIDRFLAALSRAVRRPLRFYLVGGAAIVDLGLRRATVDIDFVAHSDDVAALDELYRQLPALKDQLDVNVEWASPADFLPIPEAAALARARYVRTVGTISVYHYDYASVALAKIARGAERDFGDVELLVRQELLTWSEVEHLWQQIRDRPWGRARQTPAQVEQHLGAVRARLQAAGLA